MARKKKLGNEIPSFDIDRMTFIWRIIYKNVYSDSLIGLLFDFNNITSTGQCSLKSISEIPNEIDINIKNFINNYYTIFYLSGDADFGRISGLNDFLSKKYRFRNYEDYISHMHQFYNFSLCPVNAAMNSKKGLKSGCNDCFPLYIYRLNEYYNTPNNQKLDYIKRYLGNPAKGGRPSKNISQADKQEKYENDVCALRDYFGLFTNFNNYCQEVFFYGDSSVSTENVIKKLLDFGEKINNNELDNKHEYFKEYLDIVIDYWRLKYKIAINMIDNKK